MKILLTGLPKSGKSTMLAKALVSVEPKHGLFSPEVRENDERIGFDLRNERGETAVLSRVGSVTDYPVGRYYVDLASFETFIKPLFKYGDDEVLFIDEIGQMQLYSDNFKALVRQYVNSSNDFVGTISQVYDHPFIDELMQNKDILVCTARPENRKELGMALEEMLSHRVVYNAMTSKGRQKTLSLARSYLANDQYVSLRKLFKNAIPYIRGGKVRKIDGGFAVDGYTGKHYVRENQGTLVCDCNFFNGRGQFIDKSGECSHIQSVKIFSASSG